MMTPLENLHYAIGELAYATAAADGKIDKKERDEFHNIVKAELRFCKDYGFDISDIIFQILDKDKQKDVEEIYNSAMHTIKTNSHYLSPKLKATFIKVMEHMAKAFPLITPSERSLVERFKKDIAPLNGDPIYYASKTIK
jgi:uncharacterized tellurite resistance protein B-like protein